MTYTVRVKGDGTWDLEDDGGSLVLEDESLPVTTPDDVIDAILDDLGIGSPQRKAFKTLLKRDWEVVDER